MSPLWATLATAAAASLVVWALQRARYRRRLRTFTSLLASFREGDFSVRARTRRLDATSHELLREVNALGDALRAQRLGALEAWALLRKVMAEVDAIVLAFDEAGRIRLANDAAARAIGKPVDALVRETATATGLTELLAGDSPRVARGVAALGPGPFELRRGTFRLVGQVHTLVVLLDTSRALREQERDAWKRLIAVMGHEINNSLAPIESIADNLQKLVAKEANGSGWADDVKSGLAVVERRASGLGRFMVSYSRLARLPPPSFGRVNVRAWATRVAELERRLPVRIEGGSDASVRGDPDQLDQVLINLVKNAVDASLETASAEVTIAWSVVEASVEITVRDRGPGVADAVSLFVPFFTTKPGGTGIGLALAREIVDAHHGRVSLENRSDGPGACAVVRLPV